MQRKHPFKISHLLLLGLLMIVVAVKLYLAFGHSRWNGDPGFPLYQTEAAMQFRFSELIATGEGLPATIVPAQSPEGVRRWVDLTVMQEYWAGLVWRAVSPIVGRDSFPVYTVWFIALFSTLPILVIFPLARFLTHTDSGAWMATVIYALHPYQYLRVTLNFGRENFALFWIFLAVLAIVAVLRLSETDESDSPAGNRIYAWLAVGVVAQLMAFLSWHLSRFAFDLMMLALLVTGYVRPFKPTTRKLFAVGFLALVPFFLLLPVLRERWFVLSPGSLVGLLFVGHYFLFSHIRNLWIRYATMGLLAIPAVLLRPTQDSHVISIILDKVRFFFVKPANPLDLSPESRVMWIEAFHSPGIDDLLYYLGPFAVLLPVVAIYTWRTRWRGFTMSGSAVFATVSLAVFTGAFLFFNRLNVFMIFFLALGYGFLMAAIPGRPFLRWLATGLIGVILLAESLTSVSGNPVRAFLAGKFSNREIVVTNYLQNDLDVLEWIGKNTGEQESFAGWIGTTPSIYAYAHRPIVLHSKFENQNVRRKFHEFTGALFSNQEDMASFCHNYDVNYVVYQPGLLLEHSRDSNRYMAGTMEIPDACTAWLMQFDPFQLDDFELVYQNPGYRIYRFLGSPDLDYLNLPIGYEPIYDLEQFEGFDRDAEENREEVVADCARIDQFYQGYAAALAALQAGNRDAAVQILSAIVTANPEFYRGWLTLGDIAAANAEFRVAGDSWNQVFRGYPDSPEATERLRKLQSSSRKRE